MAKTFVITLPDDLEQALTTQAESLNKSPEELMLQLLSEQLTNPSKRVFEKFFEVKFYANRLTIIRIMAR
jgi:predicted transcriptional regulator